MDIPCWFCSSGLIAIVWLFLILVIKAGWIVDWDLNNKPATITNIKNNQTITIKPDEQNQQGILIESSLKLSPTKDSESKLEAEVSYGVKLWESNQKFSDWRAAIGVSYYFD